MSAELSKARSQLANVNTQLKQGKLIAAVASVYEALTIYLQSQSGLYKNEKDEFKELLENAVYSLNSSQELREIYPILLEFSPGEERDLHSHLKTIMEELQTSKADEAQRIVMNKQTQLEETFSSAENLLKEGKTDEAKKILNRLIKDRPKNDQLLIDVADLFSKYEAYEPALEYLKPAHKKNPESKHVFNRIGMTLRKAQHYEDAERFYNQALDTSQKDEYLYFNLGRVYIDQHKWSKALASAEQALNINPDFSEARKMLAFARKKLEEQSS